MGFQVRVRKSKDVMKFRIGYCIVGIKRVVGKNHVLGGGSQSCRLSTCFFKRVDFFRIPLSKKCSGNKIPFLNCYLKLYNIV